MEPQSSSPDIFHLNNIYKCIPNYPQLVFKESRLSLWWKREIDEVVSVVKLRDGIVGGE